MQRQQRLPLIQTVFTGAWRFTLVALLGFAPWALSGGWFYRHVGEIGLYSACLTAFLMGACVLLPGLLTGAQRFKQTARYFIPAFVFYAIIWCACWFLYPGKIGEWAGAILGGIVFTIFTAYSFGALKSLFPYALLLAYIIFVLAHALGYFTGEWAMTWLVQQTRIKSLGMWAWGICYGMGFGVGLGYVVGVCQQRDMPTAL